MKKKPAAEGSPKKPKVCNFFLYKLSPSFMWCYVVLSLSLSSPFSMASLFACSIHRRRKACLFGFLWLFSFVVRIRTFFIFALWYGPSKILSFSDFFYNFPNSSQRRTQVCIRWNCGMREERIRLCWIWQKQVEAVFLLLLLFLYVGYVGVSEMLCPV